MHPGVEAFDARQAHHRHLVPAPQQGIGGQPRLVGGELALEMPPHARAQFKEALPVAAPKHLLDEFLGRPRTVMGQGHAHHLLLGDEAMANMGGEFAHILTRAGAGIGVAAGGIVASHARREGLEMRQCRGTGGGDLAHTRPM